MGGDWKIFLFLQFFNFWMKLNRFYINWETKDSKSVIHFSDFLYIHSIFFYESVWLSLLLPFIQVVWHYWHDYLAVMMVIIWLVTHDVWSYILFFHLTSFNSFCVHMYQLRCLFAQVMNWMTWHWCWWYREHLIFYLTFIFLTLQYLWAQLSYFVSFFDFTFPVGD